MIKKHSKNLWIYLALIIVVLYIASNVWPSADSKVASMEPSATSESTPNNIPNPARPLLKNDTQDVQTIIADTPQANGVNGAPQLLTTELGLIVSPLCFDQMFGPEGMRSSLDITTCEAISGHTNIKTELKDGAYQTSYEFPSEPDLPTETGLVSYEVLGQTNAGTAVQTYSETGGTGRFSSIIMVALKGNLLSIINSVTGGDRCNGGLIEASVTNGVLSYTVNATPGDFPLLAWGQDKGLRPYEELEASAMSCFAQVTYTDGQVSRILLNPDAVKEPNDWSSQYKYQPCLNKKMTEAIGKGYADMTPSLFKAFMDSFEQECVIPENEPKPN